MLGIQQIPYPDFRVGDEIQIDLPDHIGQGYVKFLSLSSGIQLKFTDITLNRMTRFEYTDFPPTMGFGFFLSGDAIFSTNVKRDIKLVRSGHSLAYRLDSPNIQDTFNMKRINRLILMMAPQVFQSFADRDREGAFLSLRHLSPSEFLLSDLTPAMRSVLLQIMNCTYQGMTREIFMESKILELMAYKLDQLNTEKRRTREQITPPAEDIEKARYAGELMTRNLETPPSISKLAGQVGMCQSRLYRSFKMAYGMTPFDYLKVQRLEEARRLLDRREMNVTEVAYAVGYSNLSHFSKAFRQFTGCPPKQYHKSRLNILS